MSFLRALRAYIGLGPDEDIEGRYLYELNSRRRELDLDELEHEESGPVDRGTRRSDSSGGGRSRLDNIFENGFRDDETFESDFQFGYDDRSLGGGFDGGVEDDEFFDPNEPVVVTPARLAAGRARRGRPNQAGPGEDADRVKDRTGRAAQISGRRAARPDIDLVDGPLADVTAEFLSGTSPFAESPPADVEAEPDPARSRTNALVERNGEAGQSMRRGNHARRTGNATEPAEAETSAGADRAAEAVVRSLDSMRAKPKTIIPESFADAKLVADEFKRDIPVLLNLQGLERELARRLIDFASGICYALDGSMEKVASQVFLLIPDGAEVSDEDRRRIEERGYAR